MLTIKTTPNLYGILLQGDYQDLNAIYDALSRYLDFYQKHAITFPGHEYEYLLSLNYDIRHACMGSRGAVLVENNAENYGVHAENMYDLPAAVKKEFSDIRSSCEKGNLYFQVEILYPLVFHYMVSLDRILDDYYLEDWFDDSETQNEVSESEDIVSCSLPVYNALDALRDRAQISLLTSLLWDNVRSLFGEELAIEMYNCFNSQEEGYSNCNYVTVLLHRMLAHFHLMQPDEKKAFLFLSLAEIMDATDLIQTTIYEDFPLSRAFYQKATETLRQAKKEFPTSRSFHQEFYKAFKDVPHVYHDDFERFLDKTYGKVAREEPDW